MSAMLDTAPTAEMAAPPAPLLFTDSA
ncbi:MAG: iron-sulfur cluster insertion protein ErpA, partial [Thiomonas sp. 15-63-373]